MDFYLKNWHQLNEDDIQASITDSDLLAQAATLQAKKLDAKKQLDNAQKTYNDACQQIDTQMVQLINTQAQRNSSKASSSSSSSSNSLNKSEVSGSEVNG